ncbi:flavin reductase [Candidatus Pacearchaeota archaeon]|nr:flavin reductase [Candidatus Pacearchaeota archaeon]
MKGNNISEKITIIPESGKKYFYGYPNKPVVVGVCYNGKQNFLPVAWNTGISYHPFLYGVSIGTDRYSHELLSKADSFTINFVDFKDIKIIRALGRSTGKEIDKIKEFDLSVSDAEKINSPVLDFAYCTFECVKKNEILLGDHTLFVGEIVLIKIDKDAIGGEYETLNTEKISPIIYLGIDNYIALDKKSRTSLKNLPFHYKDGKPR